VPAQGANASGTIQGQQHVENPSSPVSEMRNGEGFDDGITHLCADVTEHGHGQTPRTHGNRACDSPELAT